VGDSNAYTDKKNAAKFVDKVNGTLNYYNLYGEHNKPTAADVGALPIAGGTLTGTNLALNNGLAKLYADSSLFQLTAYKGAGKSAESAHLQLYNAAATALKGLVNLAVYDANGIRTNYKLYGEHNKPTGTYTGNGSAASRTIETGGIGNAVLITSSEGVALLTNASGLMISGDVDDVVRMSYSFAHIKDGTITLANNNGTMNHNGVTYTYQVL
jgi:hypothetical protein